ncbi:hypothetical protein KC19_2G112200 [Ceratodon purpureus]|uniref:Uncharacterized protein n=1 Tax=Ceratodon purpureus TaxID=3225 RepID=A0A8T0IUA5_CERPU|nr:hypothetical protein KC19_2G112200 [Ceratodon purpureus]
MRSRLQVPVLLTHVVSVLPIKRTYWIPLPGDMVFDSSKQLVCRGLKSLKTFESSHCTRAIVRALIPQVSSLCQVVTTNDLRYI